MKTTIEQLKFPCEIKNKLKIKASFGNLNIKFLNGHLIKFDKTNLSVREHHKIIINNSKINSKTTIGNLNSSCVLERRRSIEWILSNEVDWYELDLNA